MTWLAMRKVLGRVPPALWAVLAVLALLGWQRYQVKAARADAARAQQQAAAQSAAVAGAVIADQATQLITQKGAIDDARTKTRQALADRAAAGDALQQLRERAAADSRARAASAAAAGSAPAAAGPDLCPDLLGRVGAAAEQLAAIADDRGGAGAACEAIAR